MPARPSALDGLSDDLVLRLFVRAPFAAHGTLHVACRRLKTLLRSPAFLQQRVEAGLAEHGLVVAAGLEAAAGKLSGADRTERVESLMFASGRWRPIAPMGVPRSHACSTVVASHCVPRATD